MATFLHYDDGKGKWQSHEIYSKVVSETLTEIRGFGETKKEAIDDYIRELEDVIVHLNRYKEELKDKSFDNIRQVDCEGRFL